MMSSYYNFNPLFSRRESLSHHPFLRKSYFPGKKHKMSYHQNFNLTSTKSIYSKGQSQNKTRTQSQYEKAPLHNQKSNTFLAQTPSVNHSISK
jgi:hypothetical protein